MTTRERRSFRFLDVMRFVSALWVMLSHVGAPPLDALLSGPRAELVRKALIAPFSGLAAVMVFFVISGFCIHYPYAAGRPLRLLPFYLQRFTRIGLPLAAAWGVHAWCGTLHWLNNVLWALVCEIIYYAIYPLLRVLMARFGTHRVVAGFFLVSWLFCLLVPETGYGHIIAYGYGWTWLVGLPVWLCGCALADWFAGKEAVPQVAGRLASWMERHLVPARAGVWVLSSVLLVLGIQEIVFFKYSLPAFGLVVLVWLLAEMRRPDAEVSWMARFGAAGYSIYLIHPVAQLPDLPVIAGLHPLLAWCGRMVVVAGASLLFYSIIEKPSHGLARRLGRTGRPVV
ncbi:MAG: acyltransferase family protein [Prosthecobacter sp.]